MNGYLKNFKEQIETLNDVYHQLIKPIEKTSTLKNWWVFGGGTALSLFHFQHRKSFDIDIFVTEAQLFDFLNPKWYIDDTALFDNKNYRFDNTNHHLALKTTNDIKVDFILNELIINKPSKNKILNLNFDLYYESVEDIIFKKIKWRKEDNLARDIFDLAVAINQNENILHFLIMSRYISYEDLDKLNMALEKLDIIQYKLAIEKIQPQTPEFLKIALNSKDIIQNNIKKII